MVKGVKIPSSFPGLISFTQAANKAWNEDDRIPEAEAQYSEQTV